MTGTYVKTAISLSGKTQEEVAKSIGITRSWLNKLCKEETFPEEYIDKIRATGVNLQKGINSLQASIQKSPVIPENPTSNPSLEQLIKTIEVLGRTNDRLEKVLNVYERTIETQDRVINDYLNKGNTKTASK